MSQTTPRPPVTPLCDARWFQCRRKKAEGILLTPEEDGPRASTGHYCRECGERIAKEFEEKLGEVWTFVEYE